MDERGSLANRINLTILSNALMVVCGIAVILPFVVKGVAAAEFKTTLSYTGFVFSFFMTGMLLGQIFNGFIVRIITLKNEILSIAVIYILCLIGLFMVKEISALIPIFILMGYSFGALVTIPFYIVSHSFDGKSRSSRMNVLDLFFAVGSVILPIAAGEMIVHNLNWKYVYVSVLILWVIIIGVLLLTKLPNINHAKNDIEDKTHFSRWTFNVYLVGLAIFLNFLSFMGFTYWVVNFLTEYLHIPAETANFGLSLFWFFYGGGCMVASIGLMFIKVNKYIMYSAIVALVGYTLIIYSANGAMMLIAISVLGLGCSCIYGSCISLGTLLLKKPSPRLVSFFIASSGVGTMAAQFYSSYVKGTLGIPAIIKLSVIFMICVFVIILYVSISEKIRKTGALERTES
ncbi:MAG TPA: MFS transporter [Victivallales bacterium]|nr:MFS transporter [Victivallales bacterium]